MTLDPLDRRSFLRLTGGAAAAAAALAAGIPLVALPAGPTPWGLALEALTEHEGMTLLRLARTLFPHRRLEDLHYAGVVRALDADAAKSAETARLLKDGVAALDRAAVTVKWVELSRGYQRTALRDQPKLLEAVRAKAIVALYDNPEVWPRFGYEGPSFTHGGYLGRGFDDLDWLPQPPEQASPRPG